MRPFLLALALFLPFAALAQPTRNEADVSALFTRMVNVAQSDSVDVAMGLMVCPVPAPNRNLVPGACNASSADHRLRVETQLVMLARLFPDDLRALHPNYRVEREGDMRFHLLLFQNLEAAPYALLTFTDLDGAPRFIEAQVQEPLTDLAPPTSLVEAFDTLVQYARSPDAGAEAFAPLTVARSGDDRAWTVPGDPAFEEDQRFASEVLVGLRERLGSDDDGYEIAGFEWDEESEGVWYVLHVRFPMDDETIAYAFLPIGDRLLLGDVD